MLTKIVGSGEEREIHMIIPFPESVILDPDEEYVNIVRAGRGATELVSSVNSRGQTSPVRTVVEGHRVLLMGGANVWFRNPIHVKESPEAKAAKALALRLKEQAEAQERAKYVTLVYPLVDLRGNVVADKGSKLLADDVNSALLSGTMRLAVPTLGGDHPTLTDQQHNDIVAAATDSALLAAGVNPETLADN